MRADSKNLETFPFSFSFPSAPGVQLPWPSDYMLSPKFSHAEVHPLRLTASKGTVILFTPCSRAPATAKHSKKL